MPLCSAIAIAAIGAGTSKALTSGDNGDNKPVLRDQYTEAMQQFQAQKQLAGPQLALQREFQPQQIALNQQNTRQYLSGTPAGHQTIQYQDYESQPTYATTSTPGYRGVGGGGTVAGQTVIGHHQVPVMRSRVVDTPAQQGMLDYYQNEVGPQLSAIQAQSNTASRTADINDIQSLGPEVLAALRHANPEQTALRDELYSQRKEALDANGVSHWEKHQLEQNIRSSQSARGFGNGGNDAAAESYYVTANDYQRRQQSQADAAGMIGLDQSLYGDPYLQITGRQGGASPTGSAFLSQAGGQQLNQFNPFDPYGADVGTYNANAQNAAQIASANRSAGLAGGVLNLTGSLAGGLLNRQPSTLQQRVQQSMYG